MNRGRRGVTSCDSPIPIHGAYAMPVEITREPTDTYSEAELYGNADELAGVPFVDSDGDMFIVVRSRVITEIRPVRLYFLKDGGTPVLPLAARDTEPKYRRWHGKVTVTITG